MSGRIIPTLLGKEWRFQETGCCSRFSLWWLASELPWCLRLYHSACWCVVVSVYWGSKSSRSQLICHLGPTWFWSVCVVSLVYVILSKVVSRFLPSSFTVTSVATLRYSARTKHLQAAHCSWQMRYEAVFWVLWLLGDFDLNIYIIDPGLPW